MSSVPGHNKYDLNYSIVELRPDYIQGTTWGRDDVTDQVKGIYRPLIIENKLGLLLNTNSSRVRWDAICRGMSLPQGCQHQG